MIKTDLHILMLEDDPLDAELNLNQLKLIDEYSCIVKWVTDRPSFTDALKNSSPDIVLSDYTLPQYNGLNALHDMQALNLNIPFIFVTGTINEETAAGTIKAGAWDYVVKDRLFRLPLAIRAALELNREKENVFRADELNRKLSAAVEQSPSHILITDTIGRIEYINPRFTEVTGFSPDEVIGKYPSLLKSGYHTREFYCDLWDTLKSGKIWRGEILNVRKSGEKFWESASISPLKNMNGEITHFIAIKEDISGKKKMEEELVNARNKAELSDKLKTAFLQNMSHEIRTPLNAIVGFSALLYDKSLKADFQKEYIDIINNSCYQLLTLMEDIFTASRLNSQSEILAERKTSVKAIMDYVFSVSNLKAQQKNLKLEMEFHLSDSENSIITDDIKLTQILSNLLNNAIKFTHTGYIEFGCYLNNNMVEFYVKDTGIGIAPDRTEKIFERFVQADENIHIDYGGTGLGLAISKSFVELMGGKIWLQSEPDKGSIFYFTIPFRQG